MSDWGTEQPIQTRLEAALLRGSKWLNARGDEITVLGPQKSRPDVDDLRAFLDETSTLLLGKEKGEEVSRGRQLLIDNLGDPNHKAGYNPKITDQGQVSQIVDFLGAIAGALDNPQLTASGRWTIVRFVDTEALYCLPNEIREFIKEKPAIRKILSRGNPLGPENTSLN